MPRYCAIVFLIFLNFTARSECKCAYSQLVSTRVPSTVFLFANGKEVAVCGFKDIHLSESKAIYSEFIMSECGSDIRIDSGYSTDNIVIYLENDTLFLETQELLAVGKNFKLKPETWLIEHIYYYNDKLYRKKTVNPGLRYTEEQIDATLKLYKKLNQKSQQELKEEKAAKRTMQVANQLMIAAISGSSIAREYFYQLQKKFQPSGEYAEWYDDMAGILQFAVDKE